MKTAQAKRVSRAMRERTESDYPREDDSETRRKVWGNAQECAHRWAANRHYEGRAGNVYFERGTIYSYGGHFPMARHVKRGGDRFILFTTRTYSNSTSRHLSDVRRAIPAGVRVYRVHNVNADRNAEHLDNLRKLEADAAALAVKASRARSQAEYLKRESLATIRNANAYAAAVGLRERLKEPTVGELAEWLKTCREAADKRTEAQRRAEAAAERKRKAKLAAAMAEWEQGLNAWCDGGEFPGYCPDNSHPLANLAFLRVRGQRLETSLRAIVPLSAVLPILAKVRSGHGYNVHERAEASEAYSVDGFELREIDQEARRVVIGCHTITFEEIERAAAAAGL